MAIVCGIDFTESSSRAATVAAHLAVRTKEPLHLVHTLDLVPEDDLAESRHGLRQWAKERIDREAERLGAIVPGVELHLEAGLPDDVLLRVAEKTHAKLIVIGPAGKRLGRASLGAHADRVAQGSHVPVLVIRDSAPFESWARDGKPLKIVLGADSSASSETALRWIDELRNFGPCEVVAVHLYWPPEQFHRLGLGGVRSYVDPDPEVVRTLEKEFFQRVSRLPGAGPIRYRSEPHLGRIADRLADLATEERADLVVVGSRVRGALERLWEGSVSRGLLQRAPSSVACVPAPGVNQRAATPRLSSVVVSTDFSRIGDSAVPLAFAAANPDTILHLVHVVHASQDAVTPHDIFAPGSGGARREAVEGAKKRLLELLPSDASQRVKAVEVHVLESSDTVSAICQAAERLGADLLCLGTHGRSGVAKLLGSVAQGVLAHSKRPVLLARAEE